MDRDIKNSAVGRERDNTGMESNMRTIGNQTTPLMIGRLGWLGGWVGAGYTIYRIDWNWTYKYSIFCFL